MASPLHADYSHFHSLDPPRAADLRTVAGITASPDCDAWLTIQAILDKAGAQHASQVHIEPDQDCWRVRLRTPATFDETRVADSELLRKGMQALESRLWPAAKQQGPMRGWFIFSIQSNPRLLQLDVVPTSIGKTYLIRLLHDTKRPLPRLDELGLSRLRLRRLRKLASAAAGMLLLADNDDHARAQTARAICQELVSPERKIVIAESPCHPLLPRTTQIVLDDPPTDQQRQTWASACQLGPDVIIAPRLVDDQTGQLTRLAAESAMLIQGVRVAEAADAIDCLLASGMRAEAVARMVSAVVVQLRVRAVCPQCVQPAKPRDTDNAWLAQQSPVVDGQITDWLSKRITASYVEASGCSSCQHSGFAGPITVYDIIPLSGEVKDALYDGDISYALQLMRKSQTLAEQLLSLAHEGAIALSEAINVYPDQHPYDN